jgi:5-methylcytosine-specific restriction endonuclease McrA
MITVVDGRHRMTLRDLSNEELMSRLQAICTNARLADVQLIAHLVEVEERALHLQVACSSLYDFCVRRLGMSGSASQRRIVVARLVRKMPCLLGHLESGKVHLSAVAALRDHLTEANVEEWVAAATGKTKREVLALIAMRAPRRDVPEVLATLPDGAQAPPIARLEPLSEGRCMLQLTVSVELRDKLERARDLLRHRYPSGDLATIVDAAVDLLLAKAEKQRLGKATHPRARHRSKTGRIARAVRREVFARDGEQCTFLDEHGQRCPARAFLELDHIQSRARGGSDEPSNLRVLCRAHNRLHAETDFGKDHVAERIHCRQRQCEEVASQATAGPPDRNPPPDRDPPPDRSPPPDNADHGEPPVHPRRAEPMEPPDRVDSSRETALRALVRLGFREREARRALGTLQIRPGSVQALVRAGLTVLTARAPVVRHATGTLESGP